jgi:hypothetical protein
MADDTDSTTVGTITAYLRLNTSDWDAQLDAAEARAEALKDSDPTIRISVDDDSAVARVAELQAQVDSLSGVNISARGDGSVEGQTASLEALSGAMDDAISNEVIAQVVQEQLARSWERIGLTASQAAASVEEEVTAEYDSVASAIAAAAAQTDAAAAVEAYSAAAEAAAESTRGLASAYVEAAVAEDGFSAGSGLEDAAVTDESVAAPGVPSYRDSPRSGGDVESTDEIIKAESRLATAQRASATATGRANLAQMRYDQVLNSRGRTDYQLAAAELALQQATQKESSAVDRAVQAQQELNEARVAAADAASVVPPGSDLPPVETPPGEQPQPPKDENNTSGGDGGGGYWKTIAAVVAALIPEIGPLTAAVVGLGGALIGMGITGVLAFEGIEKAMASGSAEGKQYSAGVKSVEKTLDDLEKTAASGVLDSFTSAVEMIVSDLPNLNGEVSTFSGLLGGTGDYLLQGVLSALKVMEPLLTDGSADVQTLAEKFDAWTSDGGLRQFTEYAERELPIVGNALSQVGGAVEHIVSSLSPLGNVAFTVLGQVADIIERIPGPALEAGGALLAWSKVGGPILNTFSRIGSGIGGLLGTVEADSEEMGTASATAFGPWGIAVGAAIAAVGLFDKAMSNTGADVDSLIGTLDKASGAFTQLTRSSVASNLQSTGALSAGQQLHIAPATLTGAALGNTADLDKVITAYEKFEKTETAAAQNDKLTPALQRQWSAWQTVNKAVDDNLGNLGSALSKNAQLAKAVGTLQTAQKTLSGAYSAANKAIATNGATMDTSTSKGQANAIALNNVISAAKGVVDAAAKEGDSQKTINSIYETQRTKLEGVAQQMGLTGAAADTYVTAHLGKIPKNITSKIDLDTSEADSKLSTWQSRAKGAIETIWGDITNVVNWANSHGPGLSGHSHGGFGAAGVAHLASGGFPTGFVSGSVGSSVADMIPTMISPSEFVVQASSASYSPGFIESYNASPQGAIQGVVASTVAAMLGRLGGNGATGSTVNQTYVVNNPVAQDPMQSIRKAAQDMRSNGSVFRV